MFNKQKLAGIGIAKSGNQNFLVAAFTEFYDDEDRGNTLTGYELKSYRPGSNTAVSKIYIAHTKYEMPTNTRIYSTEKGAVWLLETRAFIQGDTGLIRKFIVDENGNLKDDTPELLRNMSLKDYYAGKYIDVLNNFSEESTYNMEKDSMANFASMLSGKEKGPQTAFYLVKKSQEATRAKAFVFQDSVPAPPPQITITIDNGDGKTPLMGLMQNLQYKFFTLMEMEHDPYLAEEKFRKKIMPLGGNAWMENPRLVFQNDTLGIFAYGGKTEKETKYICYNNAGKKVFDVPSPDSGKERGYPSIQVSFPGKDAIIINPEGWAFCVDMGTGKVKWTFVL